jgi:hypothetical protein
VGLAAHPAAGYCKETMETTIVPIDLGFVNVYLVENARALVTGGDLIVEIEQ